MSKQSHRSQENDVSISENEAYFRHLAEALPQMLWTAEPNGMVDWVNKQWRDFTGLGVEETAGTGWTQAIHPDDYERTARTWEEAWSKGAPYEITYRWMAKDGNHRWFLGRAVPVRGSDGEIIKWFGSITDIHESKLNVDMLEERIKDRTQQVELLAGILSSFVESGDFRAASKELLHLALSETASSYGFIGATVGGGPHGTILRVFADEGFKWSPTENRELYEKIMRDYEDKGYIDFPRLDNLFGWPLINAQAIIANDPRNDSRSSGRTPKGHPAMDNFLGVPIFKGDHVVGLFGLANRKGGYTEEHTHAVQLLAKTASVIYENYRRQQNESRLIEDRLRAEEKLKESNQSLLDLAYVVSHELQEPLRIIKSELSLLSARYSDRLGADADEFIRSAHVSSDTVTRMVDDLWEYARIERPHVQFEQVDLNELVEQTTLALSEVIEETKADVSRDALPIVLGERRELSMLLKQLLLNALIHNARRPEIRITSSSLVNENVVCFADNGKGFETTESAEIFKMFRKLDKNSPGTGMGLSIAKRIVEFHGGRIWAESTKGLGSKVYVSFPSVESLGTGIL